MGDVVQVHSLEREAFNGLFGTLTHWLGDANRWAVELENSDKVMSIRAINLSLARERKAKPLPGNNQVYQTLIAITGRHLQKRSLQCCFTLQGGARS